MLIALNIQLPPQGDLSEYDTFTLQLVQQLTAQQPTHTFLLLSNRKDIIQALQFSSNASFQLTETSSQITSTIKKQQATIVIHFNGSCFFSLKIPQLTMMNNLQQNDGKLINKLLKPLQELQTKKILNTAKQVILLNEVDKAFIVDQYKTEESKLAVISPATNTNCKPIDFEEREKIKQQYADGIEYFAAYELNDEETFINLLKEFSQFKKWQKSSMKLVSSISFPMKQIQEKIATYKYRADIVLLENISNDEWQTIQSASYGSLFLSPEKDGVFPILNALQASVPVVTIANEKINEICGEYIYQADNKQDKNGVAEQMLALYKDELTRSKMIDTGLLLTQKLTIQNSAIQLWNIIKASTA